MQIDSMNNDIRIFESRPQRCPSRYAHQLFAAERIPHQYSCGRIRDSENRLHQIQPVTHMKDIWPKLNTITDGTKFGRTLQDACSKSAGAQAPEPS